MIFSIKKKLGIFLALGIIVCASILSGCNLQQKETEISKSKQAVEYKIAIAKKEIEIYKTEIELNQVLDSLVTLDEGGARALDLSQPCGFTAEEIEPHLEGGLVGLSGTFIQAEQEYGVNAIFLVSLAALESAWGTINFLPNNMFGYGSFSYDSKEECILHVGKGLGENYLSPDGSLYYGTGIDDVHVKYASSPTWDDKLVTRMEIIYKEITAEKEGKVNEAEAHLEGRLKILNLELALLKSEAIKLAL